MNKKSKNNIPQKVLRTLLSSICLIFALSILFTSCINAPTLASIDEMNALKAELNSEIDALKAENEAARAEIDALKALNTAMQGEIDTLKADNAEKQGEIDDLKENNTAMQDKIDDLEADNTAAQDEIDDLKTDNAAAQDEIDDLKADNAAMQDEINDLKAENAAMQEEIEALKKQIEELQNGITPSEPTEKIRIYIDQGHNPTGFYNSGATGNGLYEQDLTFNIGCLLAALLEADGRFEVCLSRPTAGTVLGTDRDSSLAARAQGATDFGADFFISLHTNAYEDPSVTGVEVFVAESGSVSYAFGSSVLDGLLASTSLNNRTVKLDPELYVLRNATMPAILVEMGFITNPGDAALLSQSPHLFAEGIYDGILSYFGFSAQ